MKEEPLVSVIIIFLNEERFLRQAIESVIAQSYDNWELLLIDDGSTDKSPYICQEYTERFPNKVRYLTHADRENQGMSASRNLGIQHAQGDYIAFLDGDDVWLEQKLDRQLILLRENPEAVMVYGPLKLWYSWTGLPEDEDKDFLYGLQAFRVTLEGDQLMQPPELLALFLRYEQLIPAGIMIERQVILDVGGYVDSFRGNFEDAVLLAKVCLKYPVYVSSECWYIYRQHPDSCTEMLEQTGKSCETRLMFLRWAEEYLKEHQVKNKQLLKAIHKARWTINHPQMEHFLSQCRIRMGAIKKKLTRND